MTTARIYGPAKNAMRSIAQTKSWVLDFEQASPKAIEPLMGWTSSADVRQQVRLRFDSKAEAIAYCEQNGIAYRVFEPALPSASSRITRTTSPTRSEFRGRIRTDAPAAYR
jgi:hypothetical protein